MIIDDFDFVYFENTPAIPGRRWIATMTAFLIFFSCAENKMCLKWQPESVVFVFIERLPDKYIK
jgi:hypothetical protein